MIAQIPAMILPRAFVLAQRDDVCHGPLPTGLPRAIGGLLN